MQTKEKAGVPMSDKAQFKAISSIKQDKKGTFIFMGAIVKI